MTCIRTCLILISAQLPALMSGQSFFQSRYDFPGFSVETAAIAYLPTGQIAVGGHISDELTGKQDAAVMLLSGNGNLMWAKRLDALDEPDRIVDLLPTPEGKIIALTGKYWVSEGFSGVLLIDQNGNLEWSKKYDKILDIGRKMASLSSGYLILGGSDVPQQGMVTKIDASGQVIWSRVVEHVPQTSDMVFLDAWEDSNGAIYITGYYSPDGVLLKLDPGGNLLWIRQIDTAGKDGLERIAGISDNRLILGGITAGADLLNKAWVLETDPNGNIKWSRSYGSADDSYVLRDMIVQGASPVFSVSGTGATPKLGTGLARLNDSGDLLWIKSFDPAGQFAFNPFVASAPGNGLVVVSDLQSGSGRGFYVLHTNATGDPVPCCTPSQNLLVTDVKATSKVFVPNVSTGPGLVTGNWVASNISPVRTDLCKPETIEFTVSDSTICPGGCLDLTITDPTPGTKYSWAFNPPGSWTPGNPSRVCFNTDSARFIITLSNGCTYQQVHDTVYLEKRGNLFPNAFTPNNDQANDVFMPQLYCPVADYHFVVYNRWGEIMFETVDPGQGWDGTFNGLEAAMDMYVYVVEFRSAEAGATGIIQKKGSVTLLR